MPNEGENIYRIIQTVAPVDAIYLYGSRAKQTAHESSDWDVAVILLILKRIFWRVRYVHKR